MSVSINVHDSTETRKIRKALDLLLRIGEAQMQAIADFAAAQSVVSDRMDAAITRIEEKLAQPGLSDLTPEDQQMLNDALVRSDGQAARLEALGVAEAVAH